MTMFELIKALEIMTFMLFNLDSVNNTILSCFFFFLITYLYFSFPAVIAQIFNPVAELLICVGIPTQETNAEMEIQLVIVEITVSKCSI